MPIRPSVVLHQDQWSVTMGLGLPRDQAAPAKVIHMVLNAAPNVTMRTTALLLAQAQIAIVAHGHKAPTATP